MKRDVVTSPVPDVARVSQQVVHFVTVAADFAKMLDWRLDKSALRVKRIEIHDDENHAVASRRHLAVEQQRLVVDRVETKVVVEMERAVLAPDPVQIGDQRLDISRPVPVALLELVFLRIEILFAAGERGVFAQLEAAVNAVNARQRGCEYRSESETSEARRFADGRAKYRACW